MFNDTDLFSIPVGSTDNLERVERSSVEDVGYMPDECDGLDCQFYYQCKDDPEDYDICPLMDTYRR